MRISYNWLKEFVDIPVSAKKLAEDLCLFGHEVDKIYKVGNDYVIDFEITANRGDCLSILGMAREVTALYNLKLKNQRLKLQLKDEETDKKIDVRITEPKICPRFTARIIDNIKTHESPDWIKKKLELYGFKSINNIVDITNLVMIESGQPLHAFDFHKINCGNVIIRRAKIGESLITLDGQNRKLDSDTIIIEDGKKIYDLCGIMGGFNSEIDKNTKTILLQGSVFDPVLVRRTSKRLKLTTDASYRFERKIDYNGAVDALYRATELIKQCCSNTKTGKLIDIKSQKTKKLKIEISTDKINNLTGKKFSKNTIVNYLKRLNINCQNGVCIIPSYRQHDLTIWQALAGEVARIYGLNKLPRVNIRTTSIKDNMEFNKKEFIKDTLVENDFSEIYSYSFSDEKLLKLLEVDLKKCRYVINSVSAENKYLRPNLLPSILAAVAKNPWEPEINIFEIGKVFDKTGEKWQLAVATTNKRAENIKHVLKLLNTRTDIVLVSQKVLDYLKIRRQVKYIIIDIDKIKIKSTKYQDNFREIKFNKISEFPPTIRDFAFVVNKKVDSKKIKKEISCINKKIFLVELFDEYESGKLGINQKSLAYHIWMQDIKRSMNEKEVQNISQKIITHLNNKFGARLRG